MTTKTVVTHHSWKERELEPEDGSNRMTVCGDISVKLDVANVIIIETQGNLFTCPSYFSLAHCVSEDMVMSRGIATAFKRKFEGIGELKAQGVKTGGVAVLERDGRYIYYLVTKVRYSHKPTYYTLRSSLDAMKEHCYRNNVKTLAMPKIGCGLDQLSWDKVSLMIRETFKELDITINVYYL